MHGVLRGLVAGLGTLATCVGVGVMSAQALPRPDQTLVRTVQPHAQVLEQKATADLAVPLSALPPLTLGQSASAVPVPSTPLQRADFVPTAETPAAVTPTAFITEPAASAVPPVETTPANAQPTETTPLPPTVEPTAAPVTPAPTTATTAAPPDVKLIRHGRGRGYWLEVTPPVTKVVAQPTALVSTAVSTVQTQAPRALPTLGKPVSAAQRSFVPPAQTVGYQGVPAPPVANGGYPSNYLTVSTSSNYQPSPSFPSALNLPPVLNSVGSSLHYPLPLVVPVTSGFGWRVHPLTGTRRFHSGVDLGAAYGTPVLAALAGQVVAADFDGGYGLRVLVQTQVGDQVVQTLYAHLSGVSVQVGQVVQPGQPLGFVGSSGATTGPHLHFELRELIDGQWSSVDSQPLLPASLQTGDRTAWSLLTTGNTTSALPSVAPSTAVTLRVALAQKVVALQLASSTPAWILDTQQRAIGLIPQGQNLLTTPNAQGIQLGTSQLPSAFFLQPSGNGLVAVGGQWYRGTVLVVSRPGGLTVVNWVNLEQYLTSVVGAEAYPSWGMEALKAQAVAARSYALQFHVNPVNALYDLDSSTRYQAYRGTATEYNTTATAVALTSGQVMLNPAGQVLLAEYAATQAFTDEAHGGFGMSQWGAASLAQQGYDYRQILGHYYQGAALTVLAMQAR